MAGPDDDAAPERIAKVLSRAGIASRRDAERLVAEGRVAVNGRVIDSPATLVGPTDAIAVDGVAVAAPEPARLWLFHKPAGYVTTARDEQGRATIYDLLPPDLPMVMPVGRLDLTSEGLLLLTNDGGLKRRLELPSTGWTRKYRVRVNGRPDDATLAPLRLGLRLGDERFQPMEVAIDRQQGANAWLTVAIREGRNREVRRAMEAVGLTVNRLIRTGFGPFRLGDLAPGAVEPVRARVLREQLGLTAPARTGAGAAGAAPRGAAERSLPEEEPPRARTGARAASGGADAPGTGARRARAPLERAASGTAPRPARAGEADGASALRAGARGARPPGGARGDGQGPKARPGRGPAPKPGPRGGRPGR